MSQRIDDVLNDLILPLITIEIFFFFFIGEVSRLNQHAWHSCRFQDPNPYLPLRYAFTMTSGFSEFIFYKSGEKGAVGKVFFLIELSADACFGRVNINIRNGAVSHIFSPN